MSTPRARIAIVLIAAVAENGVIGARGALPWRLKSEMEHFRRASMGKPVVMGRKTFASIGQPLVGRTNIVVSRDAAGKILVNGGAVPTLGGTATVANTALIQVFGQAGNDQISLDEANGTLPAANLFGGAGNDTLTGGSGNDLLFGEAGNDTIHGGPGDDFIVGGTGNNLLYGDDGRDVIFGGGLSVLDPATFHRDDPSAFTVPPDCCTRWTAAAEVPPVASRSSTRTTRWPEEMASTCISISAEAYSSS